MAYLYLSTNNLGVAIDLDLHSNQISGMDSDQRQNSSVSTTRITLDSNDSMLHHLVSTIARSTWPSKDPSMMMVEAQPEEKGWESSQKRKNIWGFRTQSFSSS